MLIEKVMMKDFDLITCNYVKRLCLDMMKDFESLIDVKTRYEVHNNKRLRIMCYYVNDLIIIDINLITNNYSSSLHTKVYHYRRC